MQLPAMPKTLSDYFLAVIRDLFIKVKDLRTRRNLEEFAIPSLLSGSPKTISSAIVEQGAASEDWSGAYRLFSQSKWDVEDCFDCILRQALAHIPKNGTAVLIGDDSLMRKTSISIAMTSYMRDPVGVKFRTNLVIGQRFLEFALLVASRNGEVSRAIPVSFEMIPPKSAEEKCGEKRRKMLNAALADSRSSLAQCENQEEMLSLQLQMALLNKLLDKRIPAETVQLALAAEGDGESLEEMLNAAQAKLSGVMRGGKLLPPKEIEDAAASLALFFQDQSQGREREILNPGGDAAGRMEFAKRSTVSEIARARCLKICEAIKRIRPDLKIVVVADGGFANKGFLVGDKESPLPEDVTIVVRCRKDSKFRKREERNGKTQYGETTPTPEQLLKNQRVKAETCHVPVPHGGRKRTVNVKLLENVCWQRVTGKMKGHALCILSDGYNLNKRGRRSRTSEMYLYVLGEMPPPAKVVEWYLARWEIEVGFRDQKFELGLGKSQVWNKQSVGKHPAYVACCYASLLLASLDMFDGKCPDEMNGPKRDVDFKNRRLSLRSMLRLLGEEQRSAHEQEENTVEKQDKAS